MHRFRFSASGGPVASRAPRLAASLATLALLLTLLLPAAQSWATDRDPFVCPWEGRASGHVREFSLSVGQVQWEIAPGRVVQTYAYNGQIPGPELRVAEGDTVRVTVTNTLSQPTTIHWHGIDLPVGMDGTPDFSQQPIAPGGSFTYEFVATPAGTRWYHSHVDELVQHGGGLYGPLIVEPRDAAAPPPDREYTLLMGELATLPANAQGSQPSTIRERDTSGHAGHGRMAALSLPTVNGFVVNGKAYPAAAPLSVTQGQRVRLRLINAGLAGTQKLALAGHHFTLTHSDGNPLAAPVEAEAVLLGPGERADVEFTADNPGRWQLRSLTPGQAAAGLMTEVVYTGHEADPVQGFAPGAEPQPASYRQFGGPAHRGTPDRTYQITLTYSMNDGAYTFNGKAYPDAEAIQAQVGQRVRVRILNMNLEDHPIHLHGHSFQVVGIEDQPVDGPIKDTLTLHHGEQYDIEFVANNPGTWLLHCHNVLHMAAGMMTEVHYQ